MVIATDGNCDQKHSAVDEAGVCQWMRLGRRGRADDAHDDYKWQRSANGRVTLQSSFGEIF